jgi:dipeptidyl aminopeptidase/acylaminoacyl peptidase
MDGSVPRRLAEYESVANGGLPEFSGDGSRVAGVSSGSLIVANADGTDRRAVGLEVASSPIWSPTGTHIAYIRTVAVASQSTRDELRVVDVSSGQDRVVAQLSDNGSLLEWSPTGDEIMFMLNGNGEVGPSSLYAVNIDTGHWTALAYGAGDAAWQWIRDEGES